MLRKVKREAKKQKRVPPKKIFRPQQEETSSSSQPYHDITSTPDSYSQGLPGKQLLSRNSTSAPIIGEELKEEGQERGQYVTDYAALLDKHILSKQSFTFIISLLIIGGLVLQDNGAGNLKNFEELLWTIKKAGILLGLLYLFLFCQFLCKKISGASWIKSKP